MQNASTVLARLASPEDAEAAPTKLLGKTLLGRLGLAAGRIRPVVPVQARTKVRSVVANPARGTIAPEVLGEALFGSVGGLTDIDGRATVSCCASAPLAELGPELHDVDPIFESQPGPS